MFISTALQGFNSNYFNQIKNSTTYPAFSQTLAFRNATSQVRLALPDYVNTIRIYAWGGGGGGGRPYAPNNASFGTGPLDWNNNTKAGGRKIGGNGGDGGFVQADVPIAPGTVLYIRVGGGGSMPGSYPDFGTGGGAGGGYSSVELPTQYPAPTRYIIVAGGGGGGGIAPKGNWPGNAADSITNGSPGGPAFASSPSLNPNGGGAGSLVAGGTGGTPSSLADGGFLQGASANSTFTPPFAPVSSDHFVRGGVNGGGNVNPAVTSMKNSGAGGGGYYGGGAGNSQPFPISWAGRGGEMGGGGGSSYFSPQTSNITMANSSSEWAPLPSYPILLTYDTDATEYVGNGSRNIGLGGVWRSGSNGMARMGGSGLVVIVY